MAATSTLRKKRQEPGAEMGQGKTRPGRGTEPRPAPIKRRRRPKGWSPMSDWMLVRTKTGRENWARINCENQAMETWLPRVSLPGHGKLQPVFPGYLFVRPGDQWPRLRSTYGVLEIVSNAGQPLYVPKDVMRALRKNEDGEGLFRLPDRKDPVTGDVVEIQIGPWKKHFGVYDGMSASGRSRVLLQFMGQDVVLEFSRRHSIAVRDDVKLV